MKICILFQLKSIFCHTLRMTLIYQDEIVIVSDAIVASMVVYDLSTQPNYDSIFLDLVESTCILVTKKGGSGSSMS